MTEMETVLLAVNQALEATIQISVKMDALESLLIEKRVITEKEIGAQIAKLRAESKVVSDALRAVAAGGAIS